MKSFRQYITEEDDGGIIQDIIHDIVQDIPFDAFEALPGRFGGWVGGAAGFPLSIPTQLGNPTWPPLLPIGNPPWHGTHPDNNWDNPPPGWKRVGNPNRPYQFEYVPYPQDGYTYQWNPSNGTWKRMEGPPAPWQSPEDYVPGLYNPYAPEPLPSDFSWENYPSILPPDPNIPFNPDLGKPRNPEIGPLPPGHRPAPPTRRPPPRDPNLLPFRP